MNNKILLGVMILLFNTLSVPVDAQLEVQTSGDVVISKRATINGAEMSASKALNVKAPSHSGGASTFGICSYITQSHPLIVSSGSGIGVYGCTKPYTGMSSLNLSEQSRSSSTAFYAGVVGQSTSWVGVYGTTSNSLPTIWSEGNYAGYFEGNVKVNGTFTPSVMTITNDNRLQENINQLDNRNTADLLLQLNPVAFSMHQDSASSDSKDANIHYGFVAQELQKIAPELVYEDRKGYLSINYMELIPLLVQKIQELSIRVEELEKDEMTRVRKNANTAERVMLYQNNPNPFSVGTKIDYQIPLTTQSATLYIYNMNGLQIAEYPINSYGVGSVTITASHLDAGIYLYSLIADGLVIDTKRMILTK